MRAIFVKELVVHLLKVRAGNGWMVGQFKQVTPSTKKQANQGKSIYYVKRQQARALQ